MSLRFKPKSDEKRNNERCPETKRSVRGKERADPPGVCVVLSSKQEKIVTYPRGVCVEVFAGL